MLRCRSIALVLHAHGVRLRVRVRMLLRAQAALCEASCQRPLLQDGLRRYKRRVCSAKEIPDDGATHEEQTAPGEPQGVGGDS